MDVLPIFMIWYFLAVSAHCPSPLFKVSHALFFFGLDNLNISQLSHLRFPFFLFLPFSPLEYFHLQNIEYCVVHVLLYCGASRSVSFYFFVS